MAFRSLIVQDIGFIISSSSRSASEGKFPVKAQAITKLSRTTATALLAALMTACLAGSPSSADDIQALNKPVADKWALVIGISKFQDPAISLKFASKDARDFAEFLVKEAHFAPDHVRLLTDAEATRENILAQTGDKWLPRVAEPDDLVIIYFSTHGSPQSMDVGGISYLLAYNTDKESLYATGIPIQDLARIIKDRVHSQRVIVILDACHSGAARADEKGIFRALNVNADAISQGTGQLVICSSEPSQVSWESASYPNGVFTRQLIDGLKLRGEYTTLGEAFTFVRDKVKTQVLRERGELQQPVLKSKWQGESLRLAVRPASPRPGLPDLPAHGHQAQSAAHNQPIPQSAATAQASGGLAAAATHAQSFGTTTQPPAKLPNRIAVLPCIGPVQLMSDELWTSVLKKENVDLSQRPEIVSLSKDLQIQLTDRLRKSLRSKEIIESDVDVAAGSEIKSGFARQIPVDNMTELGKQSQSKYLVRVVITQFLVKDDSMADEVRARVSARLVNGETGEVLWQIKDKLFAFTPAMSRQSVAIFAEVKNVLPGRIAKALSHDITNAIKSQEVPTR